MCCIVQLCPLDIGTMADIHDVLQGFCKGGGVVLVEDATVAVLKLGTNVLHIVNVHPPSLFGQKHWTCTCKHHTLLCIKGVGP